MANSRPRIPADIEREVLMQAGHCCAVCGAPCPLERAHIIPWHKSKTHCAEDLICLCANCHQRADSERWGAKTLRAYKENPWVLRSRNEPIANLRKAVTVRVEMQIEEFNNASRHILCHALASFLSVPVEQVEIIEVEAGSTLVTVKVPANAAVRLRQAIESRDAGLLAALENLTIDSTTAATGKDRLLDASSLLPYEDPTLPNALTPEQRTEIRAAIDGVIQNIGIAQDLEHSVSTNTAEFETAAKFMLEKVRNDLTPFFLDTMDDLSNCAEREHLAFVEEIQQAFYHMDAKLRDTKAELDAWKANSDHRQQLEEDYRKRQKKLDADYQRSVKKVVASTEATASALLERIQECEFKTDSGPRLRELQQEVQQLANRNGQFRQALLQVERLAQDIGIFNFGSMRRRILETVGKHTHND